jgi:Fe-S cluster assembly ATP-binding protein
MSDSLVIKNLNASIGDRPILKDFSLTVPKGEVHAIMGPNGTGKSTLSKVLAGHPDYSVQSGEAFLDGEQIIGLVARQAKGAPFDAKAYYTELYAKMDALKMDRKFTARFVNEGFSGGEKKRCEILQLMMLKPKYAVLDETDSGLDIDALRIVSEGVNAMRGPDTGFLVITHYQRLLEYIVPDRVHIMWDGRIVHSGGKELALELEAKGYDWVKTELALA